MSKSYILSRMDWAKAYRDYEVLKAGKENLEVNSDFTRGSNTSKWVNVYGELSVENNQLKKTVTQLVLHNRIEFLFNPNTYSDSDVYTLTLWANIPTFSQWERFENAIVLDQETEEGFGTGFKKTKVTFSVIDDSEISSLRFYTPNAPVGEVQYIDKYKITKGYSSLDDEWTPHPSEINAQPYPAQVAHDMYQATEGNWVKAEQDYELLKVGKANLLPEVGEQIRSNMQPINHSNVVGFYTGTILTENKVFGKMYLFPKIPIDSTKSFRLKATFSNAETNISVVYAYDKNGELILDKEVLDESVKVEKSKFDSSYKGVIYVDAPPSLNILVEILSDDIKYIAVALGSNHIDKMTQPLTVSNWKLERGDTSTPFTPSPESLNASPFTVKLANDYYQQHSEITELRNVILQLGGQ